MTLEIISLPISTKVWGRAGIELATPGSAARLASVARYVTDCATRPGLVSDALRIPVYLVLQSACFFLLCFSIRKSTYLLLQTLQDTFPQHFEELTKEDPLYPLLHPYQIQDVTRRIKLLLTLVDYCVLYRGFDNVVKETFGN